MRQVVFLILFYGFAASALAQKVFDFSPTCTRAYNNIIALKPDSGQQLLVQARQENKNNLVPHLLEGYIDFFTLFFNEDPQEYALRKPHFEQHLKAFDSGPETDPFYRYCKALTYIQRAAVEIKFGERYKAGWDFKKANALVKDNKQKFPRFAPNDMVYGPIKVVIGTVPQGYKWITSLFGMKGSINEGMQQMRSFINSSDKYAKLFADEATFYYCYLLFYMENKPDEAFRLIKSRNLDLVNNHLFVYMAANLAINSKQTGYALRIIENRNQSKQYLQTPVWDFEEGYAKFHQLKLDEATVHFQRFISDFKGKFYVKDVLQKLSWSYYLKGDDSTAEKYRLLTIRNGGTESDADKKAYRDARKNERLNKTLLKARILNDGGYQREALALLKELPEDQLKTPEETLEYAYRLGRVYDDLGNEDLAIEHYKTTISLGHDRAEYYAARAALQTGFIYERRKQCNLAIAAYQQCLDMNDHEYKDSLDQRAKSGIARCKGE